ncbi:hypothetical protein P154DRAFT_157260 [Amniculicola lignicola CBS 123094]|uniref:Uncharacterized protein n=1 Tax=Amniculicola lignicola CBS 123094 TaxID=1392246 RepID=A0A6A5WML1_9PLEO|nr:hypothetical protein P154DRAFT_157260 [Amniculicola lignicola CBS 123094]
MIAPPPPPKSFVTAIFPFFAPIAVYLPMHVPVDKPTHARALRDAIWPTAGSPFPKSTPSLEVGFFPFLFFFHPVCTTRRSTRPATAMRYATCYRWTGKYGFARWRDWLVVRRGLFSDLIPLQRLTMG